jgi:glycosyltransferase involved in cell wall biosynthesis
MLQGRDEEIILTVFPNPDEDLPDDHNPYMYLMYKNIEKKNVKFIRNVGYLNRDLVFINKDKVQILHFYWNNAIDVDKNLFSLFFRLLIHSGLLLLARCKGFKLVETVNNLYPHDIKRRRYIIAILNFFHFKVMHKVLVFSDFEKQVLKARFFCSEKKITLLKHVNYIDIAKRIPTLEARSKIGIESKDRIFIYFGAIRPYRGIDKLIEVFKTRKEILLMAGFTRDDKYKDHILDLCKNAGNIYTRIKVLTHADLCLYINAADIVILPFNNVYSSGSIALAQSLGKPLITRDSPWIRSITAQESTLYFISREDLIKILDESVKCDIDKMGNSAYEFVKDQTVEQTQTQLVDIYKDLLCKGK